MKSVSNLLSEQPSRMSITTDCFSCCRLCLEERSDASIDCLSDELDKVIQNVLGFEILPTDECSTKVCLNCFQKVSVFHLFKVKAVNNQKIMQQMKALQLTCKKVVKNEVDDSDDVIFVSEEKADQTSDCISLKDEEVKQKATARKSTTQIPPSLLAKKMRLSKDKEKVHETSENKDAEERNVSKSLKRLKIVCHHITEQDVKGVKLNARDRNRLGLKTNEIETATVINSLRKQSEKSKGESNNSFPEQKPMMVFLKGSTRGVFIKGVLGSKQNGGDASPMFNLQKANALDNESLDKILLRFKKKHNTSTTTAGSIIANSKLEHSQISSSLTPIANGSPYTIKIARATEISSEKCSPKTTTTVQIGKINKNKDAMPALSYANKPDHAYSNPKVELSSINDSKVKVLSVNEINKRSMDNNTSDIHPIIDKQPIRISILKAGTVLQIRLADTKNNEINFNALKPAEIQAVRSTILNESHRQRIFAQIENNKLDNYSKELLHFLNIPFKQTSCA